MCTFQGKWTFDDLVQTSRFESARHMTTNHLHQGLYNGLTHLVLPFSPDSIAASPMISARMSDCAEMPLESDDVGIFN